MPQPVEQLAVHDEHAGAQQLEHAVGQHDEQAGRQQVVEQLLQLEQVGT